MYKLTYTVQTVQQHVSHLSAYRHVSIFSWMFTIAWCLVVGLGLALGLGLDLASVGKLLRTRICATLSHCHTASTTSPVTVTIGLQSLRPQGYTRM